MEDDDKDEWPTNRWRGFFGPWGFPDVDEMMKDMERAFREQFKEMEKEIPRNLVRESVSPDGSKRKEIGPIVYGYSVTIGPNGKPVVREFGNMKKGGGAPWKGIQDKREPLVDVVSSGKEVRVIVELPGVDKEDIDLTVGDRSLVISVEREDRRYFKELELPALVEVKGAKSMYNNGVLEVTIPLKSPKSGGAKVQVS